MSRQARFTFMEMSTVKFKSHEQTPVKTNKFRN